MRILGGGAAREASCSIVAAACRSVRCCEVLVMLSEAGRGWSSAASCKVPSAGEVKQLVAKATHPAARFFPVRYAQGFGFARETAVVWAVSGVRAPLRMTLKHDDVVHDSVTTVSR
jgi:hypothetical protein